MPVINDWDQLAFFGRYLVFANESFNLPIGNIQGLSFPFNSTITRGSIPLFAILFKLSSKIYAPLSDRM